MSRRAVGSMLGRPHRDQMALNRRNQDTMVGLSGGIEAAQERIAGPYKPHVPEYVWDSKACRYRWRKGTDKVGKKKRRLGGSFYRVPESQKEAYGERIKHRRALRDERKRRERVQGRRT